MLKCHFLVGKTGTWFGEPSSTPPAIKNSLEYPPPAPTPGERLIILAVIPVPSNSVQNFTFSEWLNFGSNPYHSVTTKIVRSQLLLKTKSYQFFFFPNGPTIHKFEDCFPRVQVSTNGFKVFNGCLFESWILLVCLQKKKNLRNGFCFPKTLWLDNFLPSVPVWVAVSGSVTKKMGQVFLCSPVATIRASTTKLPVFAPKSYVFAFLSSFVSGTMQKGWNGTHHFSFCFL